MRPNAFGAGLLAGLLALLAAPALGQEPAGTEGQPGGQPEDRTGDRAQETERRPNILFILADQHRGDFLGSDGHPFLETPHLDRLAAGGVRFPRAFTPSPLCVPARASLFTGLAPHAHGCRSNNDRLPPELSSWPALLRDAGYRTLAVGKTHGIDGGMEHVRVAPGSSFPAGEHNHLDARGRPLSGKSPAPADEFLDARIASRALVGLEELAQGEAPWALFVGFHAPHPPLFVPEPYDARYPADELRLPEFDPAELDDRPSWQRRVHQRGVARLSEEELRGLIASYHGLVHYLDVQVGRLLDGLSALGLEQDTLVVYTSDHGDNLGEHGLLGKYASLYEAEVRVPLLLRFPGVLPAGAVAEGLVATHEVVPLLFSLCGLDRPAGVPRGSLLPLTRGSLDVGSESVTAVIQPLPGEFGLMLRGERYKLCYYTEEPGELYDLARDPRERVNRFGDPELAELQAQMTRALVRRLALERYEFQPSSR